MKNFVLTVLTLSLLVTLGCERKTVVVDEPTATPMPMGDPVAKTKTMETARLGDTVDTYDRNPTAENSADAKKAFAKLDGEIAELEEYVAKHDGTERAEAAAKLKNLTAYRTAESARFTAAQAKSPLTQTAPADARTGSEKVEATARHTGNKIEDTAKDIGDTIKDAVGK